MPDEMKRQLNARHAEMCKVFSSPTRLGIIDTLRDREMRVSQLAATLNVAVPNLSQHLAVMRGRGILIGRKDGNQVFYRVANPKLLQAFDLLREILIDQIQAESALVGPSA
jgi:ArsR family transcriptional regulator